MKCILRVIVRAIGVFLGWLFVCLAKVFGFWGVSVFVGYIPIFGSIVRQTFYRHTLNFVGESVYFVFGCNFSYRNVSVGNNVRIGYGTCVGLVDIEDDTLIGPYCCLLSGGRMHGTERTDIPIRLQPGRLQRITIGRDCWLGANVVVMADIGEGSVIGSGSVITKPIPPWSVAAGNPAKVISSRNREIASGK
jgi:acetyltransferase-like isoleucine patch superfamily enzyme